MIDNEVEVIRSNHPVPVEIKNYSEVFEKPRVAKKTTIKTYIIDPTAPATGANDLRTAQIAEYETSRFRMVVQVIDQPVILTMDVPTGSAVSAAGTAPSGRHLAAGTFEYVFYGPDAWYLQAVTGATTGRVTVTKEYC